MESEARERVLDVAEQLFSSHGYATVKLKDIAKALNMKQASLYYHAPGGKEELYFAVMKRNMIRHQKGLENAIAAGNNWQDQLKSVASWFLSQPPMYFSRMIQSDLRAIHPQQAQDLMDTSYMTIYRPIQQVFVQAQASGEMQSTDINLITGIFLSIVEGIQSVPNEWSSKTKDEIAAEVIDILAYGLLPQK